MIVTTNLPFGEWTKVFPDPRLAKAVVDRLTHKAHIIDTRHRVLALPPRPRPQDHEDHLNPWAKTRDVQALSEQHINQREVGPLQAVALGPSEAVALSYIFERAPGGALSVDDLHDLKMLSQILADYRAWSDTGTAESFPAWCREYGREYRFVVPAYYDSRAPNA